MRAIPDTGILALQVEAGSKFDESYIFYSDYDEDAPAGGRRNLTNYTFTFTPYRHKTDTTALFTAITMTVTDAVNGVVQLVIPAATSAALIVRNGWYTIAGDLSTDADDPTTFLKGTLVIER